MLENDELRNVLFKDMYSTLLTVLVYPGNPLSKVEALQSEIDELKINQAMISQRDLLLSQIVSIC